MSETEFWTGKLTRVVEPKCETVEEFMDWVKDEARYEDV